MPAPLSSLAPNRRRLALTAAALAVILAIGGSAYAVGTGGSSPSAASAASAPKTAAQKTATSGAESKVKLGVFTGTSVSSTNSFASWLGRKPAYAIDYSTRTTWSEIANPDWMLGVWKDSGYRMVYGVAMLPTAKGDKSTIAAGAKGKYNKYYKKLAQNLVAYHQGNAIIRLGWEFNHPGYDWHPSNQKQFITYWRKIVKTMRAVPGAENLKFDWNVNNGNQSLPKFNPTKYYPGPKYVDYIGVDIYDISWPHYPYPKKCGKSCRQSHQAAAWKLVTTQQYGLNFWAKFARSKGKKMSLPEWAAWDRSDHHGGADNPYFISRMHAFIDNPQNHVAYQAYFNFDSPSGKHKVTTLKSAGKRYKKLFRN